MNWLKIINIPHGAETAIFKICREYGYSIGEKNDSDYHITGQIYINRFSKKAYLASAENNLTITYESLKISSLIKWLNNEKSEYNLVKMTFDASIDKENKIIKIKLPEALSEFEIEKFEINF